MVYKKFKKGKINLNPEGDILELDSPETELSISYKNKLLSILKKIKENNIIITKSTINEIVEILETDDDLFLSDFDEFDKKLENYFSIIINDESNLENDNDIEFDKDKLSSDDDVIYDYLSSEFSGKTEKNIRKKMSIGSSDKSLKNKN